MVSTARLGVKAIGVSSWLGERKEQFTRTPPSMKSSRQLPAPWNTPAMIGPGGDSLFAPGRTDESICPNAPRRELPVQVAGSRPELTQRRMARSSAFLGGGG